MGKETGIAWTQHTFNPWWGCTKVSPGCDNCYAETFDRRVHGVGKGHWGKEAPRREFGQKHWNEPLAWNAAAQKAGKPALVFCASMADWCDVDAPQGAVQRLHNLWLDTPWLRWQMLTKRPARIRLCLPSDWGDGYPNVWLGTTVEDRAHGLPRVDVLRAIPAQVRFLSIEPLIEDLGDVSLHGIDWVIVGGESGGGARRFDLAWARNLLHASRRDSVPFFMKQLGARPEQNGLTPKRSGPYGWIVKDVKGGDMNEWPADLRVQEFPVVQP